MASIARDKGGNRRILFVAPNGKRPTIRLGKISHRAAEGIKYRVEQLLAAKFTGQAIDSDTARWIAELDSQLADRLARVGLIDRPQRLKIAALEPFIEFYTESRTDVKQSTREVWRQGKMGLVDHFGATRPLARITAGDADGYKMKLIGDGRGSMTIRKRLQFATTIFRAAVRHKLIGENPFSDVSIKAAKSGTKHFIKREETDRLLAVCEPTWRTIIALTRFGGLRCPSEVLSLRWENIDWEHERMTFRCPKTEHHPGKETRTVPLFPELKPILAEAFELAPEGAIYVVDERYRKSAMGKSGWRNCNLRTQFKRIIGRAGLTPWPRLFHNLRSTRQTELEERFPTHVVCAWLGNSPKVAAEHYLQVTDDHFARAVEAESKAAQNAAQQAHAQGCTDLQFEGQECEFAEEYEVVRSSAMVKTDGEGFEPPLDLHPEQFSRLPPSTTRPPIQIFIYQSLT